MRIVQNLDFFCDYPFRIFYLALFLSFLRVIYVLAAVKSWVLIMEKP